MRADKATMQRTITHFLCALGVVLVAAPIASASSVSYKGASADGAVVFFETDEQLVAGDTDTKRDVYERAYDAEPGIESYVTREVSLGPAGGNAAYGALFEKASSDGSVVFFSTEESLVGADMDLKTDVYMRDLTAGTTTLISVGQTSCAPSCGNGAFDTGFAGASADGTKILFVSEERVVDADTDGSFDIYVRNLVNETTNLVSAGSVGCSPACGNEAFDDVAVRGISANGSHVYFTTAEKLAGADADNAVDIYVRDLAVSATTLASQGDAACAPSCGNNGAVPVFQGSSDDGARVLFSTNEPLVAADKDNATDVYARDLPTGPTTLISGGTSLTETASYAAVTGDGAHVFFTSPEGLVPEDTDGSNDVYEWTAGTLSLVTSASCSSACSATFDALSNDGTIIIFSTAEQLSGLDTDSRVDIYSQEVGGGGLLLISQGTDCGLCGDGPADARFDRASGDASKVVFTSTEVLSDEDADAEDDIYARDVIADDTSLVTTAPSYCPLKKGNCGATFVGASMDGRHVFFTTVERFKLEDGDDEVDVYERFIGEMPSEDVTRLVSTGNSPDLELGPPPPLLKETTPPSPASSTTPRIVGEAEMGSIIKLYTNSSCSGEPVAHGSAAELASPGISASVPIGKTTKFWATAEAEGFVSSCSVPISYTQQNSASGGGSGETGAGASSGATSTGGTKKSSGPGPIRPVAYVAPHTRITFAPASKTRARRPVFRFTDVTGQAGTRFSCKVDHHPWKRCSSPLRVKRLSLGRHAVSVRAINAAGTAEPHPAKRTFKVVAG
jgi:hypothetical protein